jgi:2-oxo-4-hydroxy-4-carboxy-5-ureidoimidazoline decarboxylase
MPTARPITIEQANSLTPDAFTSLLAGVFESSPWIPAAVALLRPFASRQALLEAMTSAVDQAPPARLLALVKAHPDLGARLEQRASLTPESRSEQASSGLFETDPDTLDSLSSLNAAYHTRFGFPFIICARLNSIDTILAALRKRLPNDPDTELAEAWTQIQQIAALRLADLINP